MKKFLKIIPLVLLLILVGYNICYANPIANPYLLENEETVIAKVIIIIGLLYVLSYSILLFATNKDKKARETVRKYLYIIGIILLVMIDICWICYQFAGIEFILISIILVIVSLITKFTKSGNLISDIICVFLIIFSIAFMSYLLKENDNYIKEQLHINAVNELENHNLSIKQYTGSRKSGTMIRSLLRQVLSSNAKDSFPVEVVINGDTYIESGEVMVVEGKSVKDVDIKKKYDVKVELSDNGDNKGAVNKVIITEIASEQTEETPTASNISEEYKFYKK